MPGLPHSPFPFPFPLYLSLSPCPVCLAPSSASLPPFPVSLASSTCFLDPLSFCLGPFKWLLAPSLAHFPVSLAPFPVPWPLALSPDPFPCLLGPSPCLLASSPSLIGPFPSLPYPNSAFHRQVLLQDAGMGEKLQVYDEVQVECTAPWLEAPHALILPHNGRNFEVQVTLPESPPGSWPAACSAHDVCGSMTCFCSYGFCIAVVCYFSWEPGCDVTHSCSFPVCLCEGRRLATLSCVMQLHWYMHLMARIITACMECRLTLWGWGRACIMQRFRLLTARPDGEGLSSGAMLHPCTSSDTVCI